MITALAAGPSVSYREPRTSRAGPAHYPRRTMKRRSPLPRSTHRPTATAPKTGEHCPATGWWIPQGSTEPWRYLGEGSVMPALNGEPTAWLRAATDEMSDMASHQPGTRSLSHA